MMNDEPFLINIYFFYILSFGFWNGSPRNSERLSVMRKKLPLKLFQKTQICFFVYLFLVRCLFMQSWNLSTFLSFPVCRWWCRVMWCVIIIFVTSSNYRSCVYRFVVTYFQIRRICSFYFSWSVQSFSCFQFFFVILFCFWESHQMFGYLKHENMLFAWLLFVPVFIFVLVVDVCDSCKSIFSLRSHAMCRCVYTLLFYIIRGALSLSNNTFLLFCDGKTYFLVEWILNWILSVFVFVVCIVQSMDFFINAKFTTMMMTTKIIILTKYERKWECEWSWKTCWRSAWSKEASLNEFLSLYWYLLRRKKNTRINVSRLSWHIIYNT